MSIMFKFRDPQSHETYRHSCIKLCISFLMRLTETMNSCRDSALEEAKSSDCISVTAAVNREDTSEVSYEWAPFTFPFTAESSSQTDAFASEKYPYCYQCECAFHGADHPNNQSHHHGLPNRVGNVHQPFPPSSSSMQR
jgi:hypothetical protein